MMVVAAQRCGGTKFTYDLSVKHNLIFLAETRPAYIRGFMKHKQFKVACHEFGQPLHSPEIWIDSLHHPEKYAILQNGLDISMSLQLADYLLIRKNFNNMVGSILKFLDIAEVFYNIKIDKSVREWEVRCLINNVYSICLYSKLAEKKITWYEDLFSTPDYKLTDDLKFYTSLVKSTSLPDIFEYIGGYPILY